MPDIVYKPIPGIAGYFASSAGDVYSQKPNGFYKLKPYVNKSGYYIVSIRRHTYILHRLVARAFLPNPKNLPQINHKNGVRTDNSITNLEWCSLLENTRHSFRELGRRSSMFGRTGKKSPYSRVILQIKNNKIVNKFYGAHEAERYTGIKHQDIYLCLSGKYKHSGGYEWKFE